MQGYMKILPILQKTALEPNHRLTRANRRFGSSEMIHRAECLLSPSVHDTFPHWEQNIPSLGMKYSHTGNENVAGGSSSCDSALRESALCDMKKPHNLTFPAKSPLYKGVPASEVSHGNLTSTPLQPHYEETEGRISSEVVVRYIVGYVVGYVVRLENAINSLYKGVNNIEASAGFYRNF